MTLEISFPHAVTISSAASAKTGRGPSPVHRWPPCVRTLPLYLPPTMVAWELCCTLSSSLLPCLARAHSSVLHRPEGWRGPAPNAARPSNSVSMAPRPSHVRAHQGPTEAGSGSQTGQVASLPDVKESVWTCPLHLCPDRQW